MDSTETLKDTKSQSSLVQNVLKTRLTRVLDVVKSTSKHIALALLLWCCGYFKISLLWIISGVALYTFLFERAQHKQSHTKKSTAPTLKSEAVLGDVKEALRLSGSQLPAWVYYPDVEKADWINKIIQRLWPYVGDYVHTLIFEQIQPSIRTSSTLLSTFTFTDIDFGENAPCVTGVKVYEQKHSRRSEIIMDMQIMINNHCNIGVAVSRFKAGISNLRMKGLLRIELQPLLGTMPLVGAVSLSFVKDPFIDFDLTDLANLFDFPGFDSLLRGAISDSVNSLFVLPDKYVLKLCPELDLNHMLYPLPKGVIRIRVLDAENLEEKDKKILGFGGGSDPYVTIKVGHNQKFKTKVVSHNINPTWNEWFDALITDVRHTNIEFTVYDDDGTLHKRNYLGRCSLNVKTVHDRGSIDKVISLSDVERGKLHVYIEWLDFSTDPADLKEALEHSSAEETLHSAFLDIYVDGAQRLASNRSQPYIPCPVLQIYAPDNSHFKTKVVNDTNDPIWEESFHMLLKQPEVDEINFVIEDKSKSTSWLLFNSKDRQGAIAKAIRAVSENVASFLIEDESDRGYRLGSLTYSIKKLLEQANMTEQRPFSLQDSGSDAVLNLRFALRILKRKSQTPPPPVISVSSITIEPESPIEETNTGDDKSRSPAAHVNDTQNGSDASDNNSVSSIEFVDKTLQSFYEGSPIKRGSKNSSFRGDFRRTASIGSEISHAGQVNDLRKRLNAKLKDLGNGDNRPDYGLGKVKLTLRYRKNTLIVLVVCAEDLIVCDERNHTSDPYVRVFVVPHKSQRKKTKVIKHNLNPTFDQKLEFSMSPTDIKRKQLNITVKNQTGFLSSEKVLMGQVIVNLSELDLSQPVTNWYYLNLPDET